MARHDNLPERLTSFIGREHDKKDIESVLDGVRLLTLTGTGGCGKTRLALEVAADVAPQFADGAYFVGLSAISDPALVPFAIAQALGVKEGGDQSIVEGLHSALSDRELLLLLDNFEQVSSAAVLVSDLLLAHPGLKALVTSRAGLRLYGEHEYPVAPLVLPDVSRAGDLADLSECESVKLFVHRARAVKADFALTHENAPAVAEICVRLDGLPLAIELAAARVKLLSPQAMLARLERRLVLLTGGAQDLPERQQTLRGAISWSYDLLDDAERGLFRWLSVFVGGCTLDAVEQIVDSESLGIPDILETISSLVDKSLLKQDVRPDDEPCFVMLETIREYARERLVQSGEVDAALRRHAAHFGALAETAEAELRGKNQVAWLGRLEREHDNLRAALQWALAAGEPEIALRMAGALARFWFLRGHLTGGRKWLEAALAACSPAPSAERARALSGVALLAYPQGATAMSRSLLEESLAMSRTLGDKTAIAYTLNILALVVQQQGERETTRLLLEESLAIQRELGDRWGIAQSLNNLGELARAEGDYGTARSLYEECLLTLRALGSKWDLASPLYNLGSVALRQGDYKSAAGLFTESLSYHREKQMLGGIAAGLLGAAGVAAAARQPLRAARLFGASERLREAIGLLLDHPDLGDYEHNLQFTRDQLDSAAFTQGWAQGRAMSLDEALDLALSSVTDTPAPLSADTKVSVEHTAVLSAREMEVLRLVATGLTDVQIAEQLSLSRHTVHAHLTSIYSKLNLSGRNAATRFAVENKLV